MSSNTAKTPTMKKTPTRVGRRDRPRKSKITAEAVLDAATANAREVTKRLNAMESDLEVLRITLQRDTAARLHQARWSVRGRLARLGRDLVESASRAVAAAPPISSADRAKSPTAWAETLLAVGLPALINSTLLHGMIRRAVAPARSGS